MKKILIGLVLISFVPQINAAYTFGKVARIYPDNGKVFFRLKNDSCKNADLNRYYFFINDNETSRAWYSMLLSAAVSGKVVHLGLYSCTPDSNEEINYIYQDY